MLLEIGQDWKENKYGVVKKGAATCWFTRPPAAGTEMSRHEALFFAAYIVAAMDPNGEQFSQILRQVRKPAAL
jgi:hypothetical protein